ncbi:hypothetical protein ACFQ1Q_00535 [Winogradskyella litorisediminis]|uniref:Tetratricopeptide repeat protein n=1 Tax=Winogradskyella litorisediminis TaxID=1156618 RepID=A0ABW3N2E7_9FLAO
MSFMGFGMQKWIYTMQPRRPYSVERKGSFTKIPTHKNKFQFQPSKSSNSYLFAIVLLVIFISIVALKIPAWKKYETEHSQYVRQLKVTKNTNEFNFLMNSGKRRLQNNNLKGAYSEFKLAKAIFPENKEANELFLQTLSILCFEENVFCNELY